MIRQVARAGAAVLALLVAGCNGLSLDTAARLRGLDYLNDDIASLLIAFDLPDALEPQPKGSTLTIDITTPASGKRHVRAVLIETDPGELAGTLPPPAEGRTYYLFGFSEADKAAIREVQAFARGMPAGANSLGVSFSPQVCRTERIDPEAVRVSVQVALPGAAGLAPLIANQSLASLSGAAPDAEIAACAGHSG